MRTYIVPCIAVVLTGCVVAPSLDYNAAAVSDIIQRVRCELAFAIPSPEGQYPTGKYQWLSDWTAKVDLSLQTVETGAVAANVSFIRPLAKTETFTFGAGAGATTTADRIARLSFTVAFRELVHLKSNPLCELPFRQGLLGNLGLKEWLESSLTPVEEGRLFVGYHESAKTGKASSDGTAPSPRRSDARSDGSQDYQIRIRRTLERLKPVNLDLAVALKRVEEGEGLLLAAHKYGSEAAAHAIGYKGITKGKLAPELQSKAAQAAMQTTYTKAQKTLQTVEVGNAALEVAKVLAWAAKKDLPGIRRFWGGTKVVLSSGEEKAVDALTDADWQLVNPPPTPAIRNMVKDIKETLAKYPTDDERTGGQPPRIASPFKELETRIKDAGEFGTAAAKLANDALADLPQGPPLDSIAQTLKFTIVASANATPNWTLVHFRGPGLGNNPFLSAQRTRQHSLEVVLGPPATPGSKTLSEEQKRQLLNLRLDSTKILVVPF